jgi:hypothetical protein
METNEELTRNPRILEIAIWVEKGERSFAIVREFSQRWQLSERTIKRYIAIAKEVVKERIANGTSINDMVRKELIEEEIRQFPDNYDLEAILWNIARGEVEIEKMLNSAKGLEAAKCKPDFSVRISAIDKICKLRGIYVLKKEDAKPHGKVVVIQVANQEEKEAVERIIEQGKEDAEND